MSDTLRRDATHDRRPRWLLRYLRLQVRRGACLEIRDADE